MKRNERTDAAKKAQVAEPEICRYGAGTARTVKPCRREPAKRRCFTDGFGRASVLLLAFVLLMASIMGSHTPPAASAAEDWDIPNGHYFTQAAGPGEQGFGIIDSAGVNFWSEFQRLGGVDAVGYPISDRFQWHGFTCQAMQRVVFQWRPEINQVYFVNVFDMMTAAGKDDWLLAVRQTPKPSSFDESGKTWDQIVNMRLAVLDANPAIKAAYYGVVGDPVTMNGLPTSLVTDMGNNYTLRAQRLVIQQWKVAVPWAAAGQVTFALGGSIAKEAGLLPTSGGPPPSPTPCPGPPVITSFVADPTSIVYPAKSKLKWGEVQNATSATIDQGIGGVAAPGEIEVAPGATTTYTMTAVGCGGSTQKQVIISVTSVPTTPPVPQPSPPSVVSDLEAQDMRFNQIMTKDIEVFVKREGVFAPGTFFEWRLYRSTMPSGLFALVKSGTSPVPDAPGLYIMTGYTMTPPDLAWGSMFRFAIDPDNKLIESNESNNIRPEVCNYAAGTCQ